MLFSYQVCLGDLIGLYRRVFARILDHEDAEASPYARYYIATSTPLLWKDIATLLGKTLKQMGKIEDAVPQSISVADLSSKSLCVWLYHTLASHFHALYREPVFLGASQHVQGERARALGWEPRPVVLKEWMNEGVKTALEVLPVKTNDS